MVNETDDYVNFFYNSQYFCCFTFLLLLVLTETPFSLVTISSVFTIFLFYETNQI